MKPIMKVKLFDQNDDKIAEIETEQITKLYDLFKACDFVRGTIRVTYSDDMYNEATFVNQTQCKVLASVFKEKPLLDYIYNREF